MKACEKLLENMRPIREKMKGAKWPEITEACANDLVELSAMHHYKASDMKSYITWGLSCAEVEIDVLTGNFILKRVDILEDTGESISPHVDLGQVIQNKTTSILFYKGTRFYRLKEHLLWVWDIG